MPVDPLEPPKFRHTKVPRGPGSPPVPVMHSPPRAITVQDQQNWKIPPCISNWKNPKVRGHWGACANQCAIMCQVFAGYAATRLPNGKAANTPHWRAERGARARCPMHVHAINEEVTVQIHSVSTGVAHRSHEASSGCDADVQLRRLRLFAGDTSAQFDPF